jgi:hypothetical protein
VSSWCGVTWNRGAVAGRIGQPFDQAVSVRGEVEDEYQAGQVVGDDVGKVPQLASLGGVIQRLRVIMTAATAANSPSAPKSTRVTSGSK